MDRTQAGGLRYLRAIALQGGLPLRPLSEARGALGRVLSRVLSLARGSQPGPHLIRGWVASLGGELPQSYRREEVYELLAEVVTTVLGLVREAGLTPDADTLARLDARCPDWRDRFPLPVGDREAAALIEQLIREAVRLPAPSSGRLRVERWLEREGEGWRLCSSLAPLERLDERGLRDWFGADPGRLPRAIQLRLESGDQALSWQGRRLAGQGAWRIEAQPRSLEGAVAAADHRLVLSVGDGQAWPGQPRRGQALDRDLPWIFEERPGGLPRWVRDGSGSVTPQYALVVASAGSQVIPESDGSAEQAGILAALGRTVWRVLGRVRVQASSGAYWRIATGQAGAREADYHWVGDQVWLDLIDPPLGFRGRPRLRDGDALVPVHYLTWKPERTDVHGPVTVTLHKSGEGLFRARLLVLPVTASVSVEGDDATSGTLRLKNWGVATAAIATPEMEAESRQAEIDLAIALAWRPADTSHRTPPEWVEVTVAWPNNPTQARLRLPFPGRGVHAFDETGQPLASGAWVTAHRLAGVRLMALGASKPMLRLALRHTQAGGTPAEIRIPIHRQRDTGRAEVRLQDLAEDVDRLLAADELLDAWVEATLSDGPQKLFSLRLSRYLCPLERGDAELRLPHSALGRIDTEALEGLPVLALRLETPADEPQRLEPK